MNSDYIAEEYFIFKNNCVCSIWIGWQFNLCENSVLVCKLMWAKKVASKKLSNASLAFLFSTLMQKNIYKIKSTRLHRSQRLK